MARIGLPDGGSPEEGEYRRVLNHRPVMGDAIVRLEQAVDDESTLPPRLLELVRYRVAQINDCPT